MRRTSTFLVMLILMLSFVSVQAVALNTGFTTEALSEGDKERILANMKIKHLSDEPAKVAIDCFDVDENGVIAIGCSSNFETKRVCIYEKDGSFKCGYSFETNGSFGIELIDNGLAIYLVRSDVAVFISSDGIVEEILEIQNSLDNNSYWNNNVFSTVRETKDATYVLKNDLGIFNLCASSYSQISVTDADGKESIIYDVNAEQLVKNIFITILVSIFVSIVVAGVVKEILKFKRKA